MRTIIAGSRYFGDYEKLKSTMSKLPWTPSVVISGGARGADSLGERWAKENNIPLKVFQANWNLHGRSAGPIRNGEMAENAEALVAFLAPESRGTANMIEQARRKGLRVHVEAIL